MPPVSPLPPRGVRRSAKRRVLPVWARRALRASILLAVAGLLAQSWRTGRLESTLDTARARGIALSAMLGFRVAQVEVSGRVHTDPQALLAAAGLGRGSPILGFSPEEARRRIESLPWVATASVVRRLPDLVSIAIEERTPIALWQHNEHVTLIDGEGANLGPVTVDDAPQGLPLIVGGDAPAHARDLFDLLGRYPDIAKRVQASSWIGSRRWDLKLDNGVEIRLPEIGAEDAMRQLEDAETSSRLFERDVVAIDLRLPGKMILRLSHEPSAAPKAKTQQGI